mgnify:FL=1
MDNIKNKTEYLIASINEFAKRHKLTDTQAYRYLKRFRGMEMPERFYDVMHTLSFKDTTEDLTAFCHRNGVKLLRSYIMVRL